MSTAIQLPIPDFFAAPQVGEVWRVPYQERAAFAQQWAKQHAISPASTDRFRICLLGIDIQNTFCIPDFELFVGGRSGMGAVQDNIRLCELIYRYLDRITQIILTLDTHTAAQIFHSVFWVNADGNHPPAMTIITLEDVEQGMWRVNPAIEHISQKPHAQLQAYALHYVRTLHAEGKYPLTIWPYHSMLGGIGHAVVSAVEEACFVHDLVRNSQTQFVTKGSNLLTENYSALQPEVLKDQNQRRIAETNERLIQTLLDFDAVLIAGQAKSHCVAWTIENLLTEIQAIDPTLAHKIYLLEDCTSPVVVPDVVDFTEQANAAFQRFADAGMKIVQSTNPIDQWLKP